MEYAIPICWIGLSALVGYMYHEKGGSFVVGTIAAICFTPIIVGIIVAVQRPNESQLTSRAVASGKLRKCPSCSEMIQADAKICRYCREKV